MTNKELKEAWQKALAEEKKEEMVRKIINLTPDIINNMIDIFLDEKNEVKNNDN